MSELQFTPVETGDMSEIPPDAPAGQWVFQPTVKFKPTAAGAPMLIFDFKCVEALTEGNENAVGSKVTKFLVIRGANDPHVRMFRNDLADLCELAKIPVPKIPRVETGHEFDEFIAEYESQKCVGFTYHKKDKQTGEIRTEVTSRAPKGYVAPRDDSPDAGGFGKKKKRAA